MNQPHPNVSAADVEQTLQREFPGSTNEARALLQQYGNESYHRETDRVRLACLKLAARDLESLAQYVKTACADYRDVLAWAEYPSYMGSDPNPSRDIAEKNRAVESDWAQYQNWRATGSQPNPPSPAEAKKKLRQAAKLIAQTLAAEKQKCDSLHASELFLSQPAYVRAESILLYMSLRDELDLRLVYERAISDGKRVALPRFIPETGAYGAFFIGNEPLVVGQFGALEPSGSNPVPLNRLDLIVVPGLAFDLRGRRLGRGKGFYDRLLSEATGVKCGICFDEQLLPELPVEPHDVCMDFIATPTRWLDCRASTPAL